ncbi:hypothetical protein O0S10_02670 [Methanocorpusculum sp. MG]|uniref:Uncharacterized protein n=1 Tax=Methanocorpusculum petauri TaxID=3002863 RepID=A0ABT4IG84_9EURY|nr:hypothetical protein [Methanocorpusculum petauri]MCZ0860133.1 hypothetical protein [Methanocorpusculum petauri]
MYIDNAIADTLQTPRDSLNDATILILLSPARHHGELRISLYHVTGIFMKNISAE